VGEVVRYHAQLDWFLPQALMFNNLQSELVSL